MHRMLLCIIIAALLAACESAESHRSTVKQAGLGAENYQPSVYIEPGNEARYRKVLSLCRQAAANRELTAAQQAELTASVGAEDAASQAILRGAIDSMFSGGDLLESVGGGGVGALFGALISEGAKGTVNTAQATRIALLNCLKATSRNGQLWTVIE